RRFHGGEPAQDGTKAATALRHRPRMISTFSPQKEPPSPMSELPPSDPKIPMTDAEAAATERPAPVLLRYYFWYSLAFVPLFPIVFLPLYFRYRSMRYHIDAEGITMRWG